MGPYHCGIFSDHIPEHSLEPVIPISGCCNGPRIRLNTTADEWESLTHGQVPSRLASEVPPDCDWWHMGRRPEDHDTRLVVHNLTPNDASHWGSLHRMELENQAMGVATWKKSGLLSLPKELRLEIWRWTLTDPSVPDLIVNIGRHKKEAHGYSASGAVIPRVATWLQPGRNSSIGSGLLRTNRGIYEEALPLLYHSIRFAPADHQGIFPLFLDSLSPYARSLIRNIKLHVPRQIYDIDLFGDPAVPLFHWAITCAQVAKLEEQLKDVEVEGLWAKTGSLNEKTKRSILYPLCKIKTKKLFGPNNDDDMEKMLSMTSLVFETESNLRKIKAAARASEEATIKEHEKQDNKTEQEETRTLTSPAEQNGNQASNTRHRSNSAFVVSEFMMARDLSTLAGIDAFERELDMRTNPNLDDASTLADEWDVISYHSGASTPKDRPPSYMSRWSTDSWLDVASTIAEPHDSDDDAELDK